MKLGKVRAERTDIMAANVVRALACLFRGLRGNIHMRRPVTIPFCILQLLNMRLSDEPLKC